MLTRRRAFASLVCAGTISSIGTGLTTFTLSVVAFWQTDTATSVGIMQAAGMVPLVLMTPVGGLLADLWDRRLVMLLGDGGSVIGLGAVAWLLTSPTPSLTGVALALACSSAFAGLTEPALRATVSDLLEPEDFDRASGLLSLVSATRWLIAPALAGSLLLLLTPGQIVLIDIATFGATLAATLLTLRVLGLRPWQYSTTAFLPAAAESLRIILQPGVRELVAVMTLATFAVGTVQALINPLVLPIADAHSLGVITSLAASGMVIGALLISIAGVTINLRRGLSLGFMAVGCALILIGVRPHLWLIALGAALFFCTLPLINACAEVMLRHRVPDHQLGRAWGGVGLITQLGAIIAILTLPRCADLWASPGLLPDGVLVPLLGGIFGVGPGRGVGLIISLTGAALFAVALTTARSRMLGDLAHRAAAPTKAPA